MTASRSKVPNSSNRHSDGQAAAVSSRVDGNEVKCALKIALRDLN